ncbi:hypothetical protein [Desertivirga xinjiangensis]|uniref:hypothetical protein n=1 Tax=Desertivirga xinjiangensis TaxID=539206 RepID=UPI00210A7298|nr:hypothetical protein [Pedobacter xinjiangensis]
MQGISTSKHQHLVDALLRMERLLNKKTDQEADKLLCAVYLRELETAFFQYEQLLSELSSLIEGYNELFGKAKTQFLSPRLKKLRRQVHKDTQLSYLVLENIRLVYRT